MFCGVPCVFVWGVVSLPLEERVVVGVVVVEQEGDVEVEDGEEEDDDVLVVPPSRTLTLEMLADSIRKSIVSLGDRSSSAKDLSTYASKTSNASMLSCERVRWLTKCSTNNFNCTIKLVIRR